MAAASQHNHARSVARRSVVRGPEAAQDQLWDVDRRRYAIDDVIWRLIKGGPQSEHQHLTAELDPAHAHMVGRHIAERAVIAAVETPRPSRVEVDRTRDQLSRVLHDSGWHRSSLESVRLVPDRHEEANRSEPARRARRSRSRLAHAFSAGASPQPMVANSLYPHSRPPAAYR